MLNRCILMGRLTRDPEVRYTQSAEPVAVARFSIAVDRNYKKDDNKVTDFFEVEAWRKKAEFAEKYLKKGQLICIEGSFQQHNWEDKDGNKRYSYRLAAENMYFAESKKQDDATNTPDNTGENAQNTGSLPSDFDPYATDDYDDDADLPF